MSGMRIFRCFTVLGLVLPLLCHGAEPDAGSPATVSLLNMRYGTLLVIYYKDLGAQVWGYTAFGYRQQHAGWKNWMMLYNANGSLTFKNPNANSCLSIPGGDQVIHEQCFLDNPRQQFEPILSRSGAVQLRNLSRGRCLSTHHNDLPYAFTVSHVACVDQPEAFVPDKQLWALIPAQGNSLSSPDSRPAHQELRR
jgi:hypothetical protein